MRTKQKKGFAAACVALVIMTTVLPACAPPAPEPPPPMGGPATSVAKWLLEKAGGVVAGKAVGFVISEVGLNSLFPDSTTTELQEIRRQLDAISQQLTRVHESLNALTADLADAELTRQLDALREKSRSVRDLYNEYFKSLVAAGIDHQAAKESGDQQRIDAAHATLIRNRNEFYKQYDTLGASSLAGNISDKLVPGDGTSVLAAKGRQMLAHGGRYLTAADSAQIRAVYDNFAEYEALAAWMRMERWIPSDPAPPEGTKAGNLPNYENARQEYLDQTRREHVSLPPVIPADTVIDVGPTLRTTNGAAMWMPVSSDAWYQPGNRDQGSVPGELDALNADRGLSLGDWEIPDATQLNTLLSGFSRAPGATPNSYLAGLNAASDAWQTIADATPWPYVWTRDVGTVSMTCLAATGNGWTTIRVPVQNAVITTTAAPTTGLRPVLPNMARGDLSTPPNCDGFLDSAFRGGRGGFLAIRSTGTSPIDHMAQGAGPHLRPRADLRFTQLAGRYLGDVDMSGADLRGADFSDTDLTGAKLTGADLRGATFRGADLSKADLTGANLAGISFAGSDMVDTTLNAADLRNTTFTDVDLTGARLTGATLTGVTSNRVAGTPAAMSPGWAVANGHLVGPAANLLGADLRDADLRGVDLTGVRSGGVDCSGCLLPSGWTWSGLPSGILIHPSADLSGVALQGADLRGADLGGINFTGADLTGALLVGANLEGANLTGARLNGADLTRARLAAAILTRSVMRTAVLTGVTSGGIVGAPVDPPISWKVAGGYLVGPGANLAGADLRNALLMNVTLTNADITGASFGTDNEEKLAGIVSGGLVGLPAQLPASGRFRVVEGYLVGPNVNLTGARFSSTAQLGVSLSATNFTRADLSGLDLTGAFMNNADLSGARLIGTDLTGVNLSAARLDGVTANGIVGTPALPAGWRLLDRHLVGRGADVSGADLAGANLTGLDLTGADLTGTDLTGTVLTNATLRNVRLTGATIGGAVLGTDDDNKLIGISSGGLVGLPAQLSATGRFRVVEGYLIGPSANLSGASFSPSADLGISLSAANFTSADLTGLNLTGAFMNNANLTNAVLTGTNLTGVNLSAATLTGVRSGGITGRPALPAGWSLVDGYLVGPGAVPPA